MEPLPFGHEDLGVLRHELFRAPHIAVRDRADDDERGPFGILPKALGLGNASSVASTQTRYTAVMKPPTVVTPTAT